MDVVCDRCKTEYEFDDALVSERGTTVKCTSCGHQFKIYRAKGEVDPGRAWTLRRPDGTVIPFDSLAVLQKWILEGRVSKMDEIARGSDEPKPLGAIAELDSFFASAEGRGTPVQPRPVVSRPPVRSLPPLQRPLGSTASVTRGHSQRVPPPPPTTSPSHRPPAPPPASAPAVLKGTAPVSRPFGGTTPGMAPASMPLSENPAESSPSHDRTPLPSAISSSRPLAPPDASPIGRELPPVSSDAPADDELPTRSIRADESLDLPRPPVRRSPVFSALAVAASLGAIGVLAWKSGLFEPSSPVAAVASAPRSSAAAVASSLETAASNGRPSLEEARDALTRLLGTSPNDPEVLAARAEVNARWAEVANELAADLEGASSSDRTEAERRAVAGVLRADAARAIERARADLASLQSAPTPSSEVAARVDVSRLDSARILGNSAEIARLEPLLRARTDRSPRAELVLALVARDRGDVEASLNSLRSLGAAPGARRAQVALARLLAARSEWAEARSVIASIAPPDQGVDELATLRAQVAGADAGAAVTGIASPTAAPTAVAAPATASAAAATPAVLRPVVRDYDRLVAEGDRLQNEGRTAAAEEQFRSALTARPRGAEALTGIGYVELDRRNYGAAISRFRQALSSNGSFSDAYIGLGEAYASQSRYSQALEAYQRYLALNPSGSRASMARRQIESLQDRVRRPAEDAPQQAPGTGESDG